MEDLILKKLKDIVEKKRLISIPVTNKEEEGMTYLRCQTDFQKGHKVVIEGSDLVHNLPIFVKKLS